MAETTGNLPKSQGCEQLIIFWWKLFLDFQYVQLISPFRVKIRKNEKNNQVFSTTWLPQKLISAFQTSCGFICVFGEVKRSVPTNPKNPSMYLYVCLRLVTCSLKVVQVKQFWFCRKHLVRILNFIMEHKLDSIPSTGWTKLIVTSPLGKIGMIILCLVSTGIAAQIWLAGRINSIEKNLSGRTLTWWSGMVEQGKYNLFLNNNTGPVIEVFVGVLTASGMLWRHLIGTCVDATLLLVAITVWLPVRPFAEYLRGLTVHRRDKKIEDDCKCSNIFIVVPDKHVQNPNWIEIQEKYETLMELTNVINDYFGLSICFFVLETILYYCTNSSHILFHDNFPDWHLIITVLYYLLVIGAALVLSADVPKQVCDLHQFHHSGKIM